jgi:heterotetrameric sarcosine oxidase gamma subunit
VSAVDRSPVGQPLQARSALASQVRAAAGWRDDGLHVVERFDTCAAMLTLSAAQVMPDATDAVTHPALPQDGAVESQPLRSLISCGPRRYLAVAHGAKPQALLAELQQQFGNRAAVVDYSDQLTLLAVEGRKSTVVLGALCSIDFDPAAFPPGRAVVTRVQDARAFVWRDDERFMLAVQRSLAVAVWESLVETAGMSATEEPSSHL